MNAFFLHNLRTVFFALALIVVSCAGQSGDNSDESESKSNKTKAEEIINQENPSYSEAEMFEVAQFFSERTAYHVSVPVLKKIMTINPGNTAAKLMLANGLRGQKEFNEAMALYNELAEVDSVRFIVLPERARLYTALQEFDKAEVDIETAKSLQPKYFAIFLADGLLQFAQGRQQEALDLFDVAMNLDPGVSSEAALNAGFILLRNGLNYDALGKLTKALDVGKNINKGYAFINRGACQINLMDTSFACADFDSAMHYMPEKAQWYIDEYCQNVESSTRYEIRDSEVVK